MSVRPCPYKTAAAAYASGRHSYRLSRPNKQRSFAILVFIAIIYLKDFPCVGLRNEDPETPVSCSVFRVTFIAYFEAAGIGFNSLISVISFNIFEQFGTKFQFCFSLVQFHFCIFSFTLFQSS